MINILKNKESKMNEKMEYFYLKLESIKGI